MKFNSKILLILLIIILIILIIGTLIFLLKKKKYFLGDISEKIEYTPQGKQNNTHPIDVVYTWVDSSDTDWQQEKSFHYQKEIGDNKANRFSNSMYPDLELDTSLRLLFRYAPWVQNVYIVCSDGQLPKCMNKSFYSGKKIQIVYHSEIIPPNLLDQLPVYNSHAIEANLHNIKGLSELFMYFNDDVYLVNYLNPRDCFRNNKMIVQPMEKYITSVNSAYSNAWINMSKLYGPINLCSHGFNTLSKSVMKLAEQSVQKHWDQTRQSKFRKFSDIVPIGYTINYALQNKKAFLTRTPLKIFYKNSNKPFIGLNKKYDVVCLNNSSNIESDIFYLIDAFLPTLKDD